MSILELGSLQLTLFAMMLVGVLYTSIFLIPMRIVMWSAGTTYFVAGETVEKKKLIKNVLTHPCLVAIYLGLLCMVPQVQLPSTGFQIHSTTSMHLVLSPYPSSKWHH